MISALGINHKTTSVAAREELAFSPSEIPKVLSYMQEEMNVKELAVISTCNRTEFYGVNVSTKALLQGWTALRDTSLLLQPHVYHHCDEPAVAHLMRVASGLDSMVVGEPQILSQLKRAYDIAHNHGSLGPHLEHLFQKSFMVAKQVRTQTAIGRYPVSIAYSAVKLAKQIFSDLKKAKVLLIGAGETIELVAQHLRTQGVKQETFANRTLEKAQALCQHSGARAITLEDMRHQLAHFDIVISAVDTQSPVLDAQTVKLALRQRKRHPILMVDLGIPRNIDPALSEHEDIYLYNLDDLRQVIDDNMGTRVHEALKADAIIQQQAKNYMLWLEGEDAHAVLRTFRLQAELLKDKMVSKAIMSIRSGCEPEQVIEALGHQLMQKLLHNPSMRIKKASQDKEEALIRAASELLHFE